MPSRQVPPETIIELRRRLEHLPARSQERRLQIEETAQLYGVSRDTLYRALRQRNPMRSLHRADRGQPRIMPKPALERYCEVIAALKIRTSNRKGRHLSTAQAIRLLEEHGIHTPNGHLQAPAGLLSKATVNRYLKQWGYDRNRLVRQPAAVRFQAEFSNDCWHFDLSQSDLKHLKAPEWMEEGRGRPLLMLYSVVDDRSGLAYQEYHGVYGEDVEAALRFLFNAMSPTSVEGFPFQGIPKMIYTDNGPIARSLVFQKVLDYLGIELRRHMPRGTDGRRVTARSKGKVERPFRTVKEMHETLYHLHAPETESEANAWLMRFLLHYNGQSHRSEPHSRLEDWKTHLPAVGLRQMCSWERFCTFAREPERRHVGSDARISVDGAVYQVEPELAGETVMLWWGLFDTELYVEYGDNRYGPYSPVGAPIPLHRYRRHKKTANQKRADKIEILAEQLTLPESAIGTTPLSSAASNNVELPSQPFVDPDPFAEFEFPNSLFARRAIADELGRPLARLSSEQLAHIDEILAQTLKRKEVLAQVRDYFHRNGRSNAE